MILLADSGSTKTDWCLKTPTTAPKFFTSGGWNPYYLSTQALIEEGKQLPIDDPNEIQEIYFYGSGCSTDTNKKTIGDALKTLFPHATTILVEHDLLGAAKAAAQHEKGIVCILGTGSNACLYNGFSIEKEIINLGFWLGDEGSGAVLGKKLVVDFLYQRMPTDLSIVFKRNYPLTRDSVLEAVHHKPKPNEFFASFTPFLYEYKQHTYCQQLLHNEFFAFLERVEADLGTTNTNFYAVGSIAYYFEEELRKAIEQKDGLLQRIVRKPIEGLAEI